MRTQRQIVSKKTHTILKLSLITQKQYLNNKVQKQIVGEKQKQSLNNKVQKRLNQVAADYTPELNIQSQHA